MLIALTSAKGAPGVTTTALSLALSWPRPVLLVDLDVRGGDVIWTYGRGQHTEGRGLLGAQVAARHAPWSMAIWSQVIALGEGDTCFLLPGLGDAAQASAIDWGGLTRALAAQGPVDVIADCGELRSSPELAPVRAEADVVLLATRSTLAGVRAARGAAGALQAELRTRGLGSERLSSLLVGPGRPYPTSDVAASLAEVAPVFDEMPWDDRTATELMSGTVNRRTFYRSRLGSGAAHLARQLISVAADRSVDGAFRQGIDAQLPVEPAGGVR